MPTVITPDNARNVGAGLKGLSNVNKVETVNLDSTPVTNKIKILQKEDEEELVHLKSTLKRKTFKEARDQRNSRHSQSKYSSVYQNTFENRKE